MIGLALGRAIQGHVADDDILAGLAAEFRWRRNDNLAAGKAFPT